jgi:hypothetical protein
MTIIAFPTSPAVNDVYTFDNKTWVWNGTAWLLKTPTGVSSPLSVKGDVWAYGSTDTKVAVGSNNQVLTADSTQSTGLKWGYVNNTVVQTVAYSGTPTINWAGVDITRITLTGNITITNSGAQDGQRIILELTQDATGGRTLAFSSEVRYGTDITSVTLTTTPSKTDRIGLIYNSAATKYDVVAFIKGF